MTPPDRRPIPDAASATDAVTPDRPRWPDRPMRVPSPGRPRGTTGDLPFRIATQGVPARSPSLLPPARRRADPLPTRVIAAAAGVAATLGLVIVLVPPEAPVAASVDTTTPSGEDASSVPAVGAADVVESPAPSPVKTPKAAKTSKATTRSQATAGPRSGAGTTTGSSKGAAPKATPKPGGGGSNPTPAPGGTAKPTPKPTPPPTPKPTPPPTPKPTPVPTAPSGKP